MLSQLGAEISVQYDHHRLQVVNRATRCLQGGSSTTEHKDVGDPW